MPSLSRMLCLLALFYLHVLAQDDIPQPQDTCDALSNLGSGSTDPILSCTPNDDCNQVECTTTYDNTLINNRGYSFRLTLMPCSDFVGLPITTVRFEFFDSDGQQGDVIIERSTTLSFNGLQLRATLIQTDTGIELGITFFVTTGSGFQEVTLLPNSAIPVDSSSCSATTSTSPPQHTPTVTQPPNTVTTSTSPQPTPSETPQPPTILPEPSETPQPPTIAPEPSETPQPPTIAPEPSETPQPPTIAREPSEIPQPPTIAPEPSETPQPTVAPTQPPTILPEPSETPQPTPTQSPNTGGTGGVGSAGKFCHAIQAIVLGVATTVVAFCTL